MNNAHLHLIINHLPIFSILFGIVILTWGLWKKQDAIQKIALVLFILGGIGSYIALGTGESAEDIVEEYSPAISHDAIHDHEEAAEIALWFSVITGGLALLSLFFGSFDPRFQQTLTVILLLAAIAAFASLAYTAYEGGKIRHPEAYDQQVQIDDD